MRAWLVALGLAGAAVAGCNHVAYPGYVAPLEDQDVGAIPRGSVSLAAAPGDGQLVLFGRRWWLDPGLWAQAFVDDVASELNARGVRVDPNGPNPLYVYLDRFSRQHSVFLQRIHCTLTVVDAEGNAVHTGRYTEAGRNIERAFSGTMYRAKQGLLNDEHFLAHIRDE